MYQIRGLVPCEVYIDNRGGSIVPMYLEFSMGFWDIKRFGSFTDGVEGNGLVSGLGMKLRIKVRKCCAFQSLPTTFRPQYRRAVEGRLAHSPEYLECRGFGFGKHTNRHGLHLSLILPCLCVNVLMSEWNRVISFFIPLNTVQR